MAILTSNHKLPANDPFYREGWSIHIGPLVGTKSASTATVQAQEKRKRPDTKPEHEGDK